MADECKAAPRGPRGSRDGSRGYNEGTRAQHAGPRVWLRRRLGRGRYGRVYSGAFSIPEEPLTAMDQGRLGHGDSSDSPSPRAPPVEAAIKVHYSESGGGSRRSRRRTAAQRASVGWREGSRDARGAAAAAAAAAAQSREKSSNDRLFFAVVREVHAAAVLPRHPHVIAADVAVQESRSSWRRALGTQRCSFLLMRRARGTTARHTQRPRGDAPHAGPTSATLYRWTYQLFAALAHTHRHGVLHRDIKPDNVLVMPDGSVALADWGMAAQLTPRPGSSGGRKDRASLGGARQRGAPQFQDVLRASAYAPAFRPPEVCLYRRAGLPADVFAAALTALSWATQGRRVFDDGAALRGGMHWVRSLGAVLGTPGHSWPGFDAAYDGHVAATAGGGGGTHFLDSVPSWGWGSGTSADSDSPRPRCDDGTLPDRLRQLPGMRADLPPAWFEVLAGALQLAPAARLTAAQCEDRLLCSAPVQQPQQRRRQQQAVCTGGDGMGHGMDRAQSPLALPLDWVPSSAAWEQQQRPRHATAPVPPAPPPPPVRGARAPASVHEPVLAYTPPPLLRAVGATASGGVTPPLRAIMADVSLLAGGTRVVAPRAIPCGGHTTIVCSRGAWLTHEPQVQVRLRSLLREVPMPWLGCTLPWLLRTVWWYANDTSRDSPRRAAHCSGERSPDHALTPRLQSPVTPQGGASPQPPARGPAQSPLPASGTPAPAEAAAGTATDSLPRAPSARDVQAALHLTPIQSQHGSTPPSPPYAGRERRVWAGAGARAPRSDHRAHPFEHVPDDYPHGHMAPLVAHALQLFCAYVATHAAVMGTRAARALWASPRTTAVFVAAALQLVVVVQCVRFVNRQHVTQQVDLLARTMGQRGISDADVLKAARAIWRALGGAASVPPQHAWPVPACVKESGTVVATAEAEAASAAPTSPPPCVERVWCAWLCAAVALPHTRVDLLTTPQHAANIVAGWNHPRSCALCACSTAATGAAATGAPSTQFCAWCALRSDAKIVAAQCLA